MKLVGRSIVYVKEMYEHLGPSDLESQEKLNLKTTVGKVVGIRSLHSQITENP